ncbi:MAG TPA: fumarylacetoacetase, partial [Flavobacteriales bacterium]|nr:fumarylacetoacetase [Flavobacteriales bacterium]
MSSWIGIIENSDFTLDNIPFGIGSTNGKPRAATRIGDKVIDLDSLHKAGLFSGINLPEGIFDNTVLNDFIELGKPITNAVRVRIQELFALDNGEVRDNEALRLESIRD